jgi:hypothetical protein
MNDEPQEELINDNNDNEPEQNLPGNAKEGDTDCGTGTSSCPG